MNTVEVPPAVLESCLLDHHFSLVEGGTIYLFF